MKMEMVKQYVARIADEFHPERVYLFGSQADGTAGADSDVDLLVVMKASESVQEVRVRAQRLFRKPALAMDLFVMTPEDFEQQKGVANTLAREVHETGMLCYG